MTHGLHGIGSAAVDFSRLNMRRTVVGGVASVLLLVSLLFLPWFELTETASAGSPTH